MYMLVKSNSSMHASLRNTLLLRLKHTALMSLVVTLYQFHYQDVSILMYHTPHHLAPRARCRASPCDVMVIGQQNPAWCFIQRFWGGGGGGGGEGALPIQANLTSVLQKYTLQNCLLLMEEVRQETRE